MKSSYFGLTVSPWYLYKMVTQNMLLTYKVKRSFSKKIFEFSDSFVISKCLQQIELNDLLHMCAPCSKLPSIIYKYHGPLAPVQNVYKEIIVLAIGSH